MLLTPVPDHTATARVGTRRHSQSKPNAALLALPRPENAFNAHAGCLQIERERGALQIEQESELCLSIDLRK
jgi:hypothetical protein